MQPVALEQRNVDWLDEDVRSLVSCGHGTYQETVPWILATGSLTASDEFRHGLQPAILPINDTDNYDAGFFFLSILFSLLWLHRFSIAKSKP